MSSYITIQDDTWDVVSLKNYNSELYVADLIKANSKYRELIFFPAGLVLNIPDVVETVNINLPPWKL